MESEIICLDTSILIEYYILPFNKAANDMAVSITKQLKAVNKLIEIPDIFIGATAVANNIKLATLNHKHFERIPGLSI